MKYYTGVGSRKTPLPVIKGMEEFAFGMAERLPDYTLRSGGAQGADSAFYRGCVEGGGSSEIWSPRHEHVVEHEWARDFASLLCWERPLNTMKPFIQTLIIRNMYQVFGEDGNSPSDFLIYWCPGNPLGKGFESGGTRYAVRAAHAAGVELFRLKAEGDKLMPIRHPELS
jgi:hypothetical protein